MTRAHAGVTVRRMTMAELDRLLDGILDECSAHEEAGDADALADAEAQYEAVWAELSRRLDREHRRRVARTSERLYGVRT